MIRFCWNLMPIIPFWSYCEDGSWVLTLCKSRCSKYDFIDLWNLPLRLDYTDIMILLQWLRPQISPAPVELVLVLSSENVFFLQNVYDQKLLLPVNFWLATVIEVNTQLSLTREFTPCSQCGTSFDIHTYGRLATYEVDRHLLWYLGLIAQLRHSNSRH